MPFSDESHDLAIQTDSGNITISPAAQQKMDHDLGTLRKIIAHFPSPQLKVEISNQSPGILRAATALRLAGRTLFAAGEANSLHAAWDAAIRRLIDIVQAYKDHLGRVPERQKEVEGTLHEIVPNMPPDAETIDRAVRQLDYRVFRTAMGVYDDPLEKRVGRWIERYPDAEARLGDGLLISEIAEEVFLNAFDQYLHRPPSLRLGQWLENLIDPSIQVLLTDEREKQNLSFIASAREAGA